MNLQELRHTKNLTQKQVADKTGISFSFIVKLENGYRLPSHSTLEKLAKIYKVSIEKIFLVVNFTIREKNNLGADRNGRDAKAIKNSTISN